MIFSGVEPPEPSSPTGLMSCTVNAELILHRDADRLAPAPGDVEVRRLAARAVGHREEVVGGESAERGERDRDPDDRAEHDVGEVVDAEVDPQQRR